MPLFTVIAVNIVNASETIVHGLIHNGVSRTPHVVCIMPGVGTSLGLTFQWGVAVDSLSVVLSQGVATNFAANVLIKRCHTIEDISGAF